MPSRLQRVLERKARLSKLVRARDTLKDGLADLPDSPAKTALQADIALLKEMISDLDGFVTRWTTLFAAEEEGLIAAESKESDITSKYKQITENLNQADKQLDSAEGIVNRAKSHKRVASLVSPAQPAGASSMPQLTWKGQPTTGSPMISPGRGNVTSGGATQQPPAFSTSHPISSSYRVPSSSIQDIDRAPPLFNPVIIGRQIIADFGGLSQTTSPQNRASLAVRLPPSLPISQHAQTWDPVNQIYSLPPPPRRPSAGQQGASLGRASHSARLMPGYSPGSSASATHGNRPSEPNSGRRAGLHRPNDSIFTTFGIQPPPNEGHGSMSEASGQFGHSEFTPSDYHYDRRSDGADGNSGL